jgi:hypothetical protein
MKVKLFWMNNPLIFGLGDRNARALEDQINTWLSENPHIKIVDIKQSSSSSYMSGTLWFVSVWYDEGAA